MTPSLSRSDGDLYMSCASCGFRGPRLLRVRGGRYGRRQRQEARQLTVPGGIERENSSGAFPRNISSAQLSMGGSSREPSPPATPHMGRAVGMPGNALEKAPLAEPEPVSVVVNVMPQQNQGAEDANKTSDEPKELPYAVNQFLRKQRKGTIDVWWLYDDGGLTMLIPYLLTNRNNWSGCKLRVFSLANKKEELDRDQRNMASLLSKFRIEYSDVTVIPDIVRPPAESSKREFEDLVRKWRRTEDDDTEVEHDPLEISDSEMLALRDKTYRHLRLRELLQKHSKNATLVAMTLPMPRKNTCSASMYMAWLETLTRDLPPFLLIRGNQTSVLTFYS
ncbi:hypothetical protein HPB49_019182 [Dermacentor silvarum]|uniref:Uncharacterized protein n=1 Tax=Dermacentor silvarum TaxID=543639 RepID=A0ACB8DFC3_DERSI|nr:bumetanide-sensitive sodium-(potassium)-chloride cotransporter [Dermacentor silvarum]KAH7966740.1 hypothetical protein HPB49_019182 [Dermacentor silvarum]